MQQAFDSAPWPARWNDKIDDNARAILGAWRAAARPVIHVRHDSVEPGSTLAPGHAGNRFRPGLEPMTGEPVISKSVHSAFIGVDLDLRLRRMRAKTIVAFGIATDMCVSTTIRTGNNLGWNMILIEDACDCFDLPWGGKTIPARDIHAAHVATLGFEFCKVLRTEDLLRAIGGTRGAKSAAREPIGAPPFRQDGAAEGIAGLRRRRA
jgi:nicotinamidase-related amidase